MTATPSTPTRLPVLGLPYPAVLLPGQTLSLPVSRALVDALAAHLTPNDAQPLLAAVPLVPLDDANANANTSPDAGGPVRFHTHAVSARATQLVRRAGTQSFVLTLHAIARVQVHHPSDPSQTYPTPSAAPLSLLLPVSPVPTPVPAPETVHAFKAAALKLLDRLAHDGAQSVRRRDTWARLATLVENAEDRRAAGVADALVAMVGGVEYREKLHVLELEPSALLVHVTALLTKHSTSLGIVQSLTSSLDRQQREHFLRQQLAAVRAELDALSSPSPTASSGPGPGNTTPTSTDLDAADGEHDPDGLAELKKKIERLAPGTDERRVAAAEWRRLKRIPNASAEWGVVRSYLDWLAAIPWPASTPVPTTSESTTLSTRAFLARARAQLDEDHYGLERVKKRLIEYLAVVRLLEAQASAEQTLEQAQLQAQGQGQLQIQDGQNEPDATVTKDEKALVLVKKDDERAVVPASVPSPKRRAAKGPILLFIGPPGTGKTSLGASIARALNRPFERIALGGVRDEGEIRGHRRTYVAASPGVLVQALRRAARPDPVILLDEVDKVAHGAGFQGDPAAALLEVLDPEQNHAFMDHYLNVPVDLSQVLFICTANTLDTIAPPLLDRCEIVQLSGYTAHEKTHIARRFLLPKQLARNGLPADKLALADDVLPELVLKYTREAGVRALERSVAAVVRHKAAEWAESAEAEAKSVSVVSAPLSAAAPTPLSAAAVAEGGASSTTYSPVVTVADLETILGVARWDAEEREREARRGIVYGLVVTGMGEGEVMPVETIAVPGRGGIKLTGSLGDVIKESGELALSWVKTHAYELGITSAPSLDPLAVREIDVHLHLPSGAQKKDGPSAGVAITCAFVSLLTGACVPVDVAMTGEITLRGRVTPVGGIKEKVLGAHRAGARKVILPWANRKDVAHDVPKEVRERVEFAFVRTLREALDAAFGEGVLPWRVPVELVQSRL